MPLYLFPFVLPFLAYGESELFPQSPQLHEALRCAAPPSSSILRKTRCLRKPHNDVEMLCTYLPAHMIMWCDPRAAPWQPLVGRPSSARARFPPMD